MSATTTSTSPGLPPLPSVTGYPTTMIAANALLQGGLAVTSTGTPAFLPQEMKAAESTLRKPKFYGSIAIPRGEEVEQTPG